MQCLQMKMMTRGLLCGLFSKLSGVTCILWSTIQGRDVAVYWVCEMWTVMGADRSPVVHLWSDRGRVCMINRTNRHGAGIESNVRHDHESVVVQTDTCSLTRPYSPYHCHPSVPTRPTILAASNQHRYRAYTNPNLYTLNTLPGFVHTTPFSIAAFVLSALQFLQNPPVIT